MVRIRAYTHTHTHTQALGSQEHGYGGIAAGGQEQEAAAAQEAARGGDGDNEWEALNPGEELPGDRDDVEQEGEAIEGGGGELAAAVRDVGASAAQGRMSESEWQHVRQLLRGTQHVVFDVLRHHIRDSQR